ncbi:hypothetical protein M404DRAFT_233322 [Pisolithus tinctorius Marx 270]|uniref:Uncharacterized protein n=1 Tax=Pisolithus tinctorius Marx 270 TaxID=870435 RepID=A0A0C3JLV0_PISTI|nr:hypothetical protein M404DRAFT_233322 [Pisolithus tinctorius Marx 270]
MWSVGPGLRVTRRGCNEPKVVVAIRTSESQCSVARKNYILLVATVHEVMVDKKGVQQGTEKQTTSNIGSRLGMNARLVVLTVQEGCWRDKAYLETSGVMGGQKDCATRDRKADNLCITGSGSWGERTICSPRQKAERSVECRAHRETPGIMAGKKVVQQGTEK